MLLRRKRTPEGEEVSREFAQGMGRMERYYEHWVIWASSYITMLEKRLEDGCKNCPYRSREGQDG